MVNWKRDGGNYRFEIHLDDQFKGFNDQLRMGGWEKGSNKNDS